METSNLIHQRLRILTAATPKYDILNPRVRHNNLRHKKSHFCLRQKFYPSHSPQLIVFREIAVTWGTALWTDFGRCWISIVQYTGNIVVHGTLETRPTSSLGPKQFAINPWEVCGGLNNMKRPDMVWLSLIVLPKEEQFYVRKYIGPLTV